MKNKHRAGFRFLRQASLTLPLLPLLALPVGEAFAASWQWHKVGQRERVVIEGDAMPASVRAERSGRQSLLLLLPPTQENFALQGQGPAQGQLVAGLTAAAQGLELTLQNPAFGYVVTRPSPRQVVIDIFHDPLGARWSADGTLAPARVAEQYLQPPMVRPTVLPSPVAQSTVGAAPASPSVAAPASSSVVAAAAAPALPASTQPAIRSSEIRPSTAQVAPRQEPALKPELVASTGHGEDSSLPELEASGTLRPEMPEVTPTALRQEDANKDLARTNYPSFSLGTVAVAAESPQSSTQRLNPRGVMITPQEVLGTVNTGGPEAWPNNETLSTKIVKPDATAQSGEQRGTVVPLVNPTAPEPSTPVVQAPAVQAPAVQAPAVQAPVVQQPVQTQQNAPASSPSLASPLQPQASPVAPAVPPAATHAGLVAPQAEPSKPAEQESESLPADIRQSMPPSPSANATSPSTNATRPVIYMDDAGNVVPKPPEPDKMLAEAERLMDSTQYTEALPILQEIKGITTISREMREKVLYLVSDATEAMYAGKALEGYEPIVSTTSEAMNANLRSPRVPDALFRLGMANIRVGNTSEGEGYFKALKRRFPYDMNVPVAFTYLGKAQLEQNFYVQAAESFRSVLQEYPESNVLRDAAVGLVNALIEQGDYAQATVIADFVDKRWARYYVSEPSFLRLMAELSYNTGKKEEALQQYWLYYNLDPERKGNDSVLAVIGDLYLDTARLKAGLEIFSELRSRYPDSEGAARGLLRLAEKGKHDGPLSLEEMFGVFDNPGNPLPQVAYAELREQRPTDARSILAGLKLAVWRLWNKQYPDAMGAAADFIDAFPEHKDVELAREVIMRAFMADLKNSLAEENYGRILILWNGFPLVRDRYGAVDAELRNALARGYLERGDDDKAMDLFAEFLKTPKHPVFSDQTFALYFNKYLQAGNWNALLDLGNLVSTWEMDAAMRGQLDYAMALSAENLGLTDRALALWQPLSANEAIPLYQKAYATYFLAKDAERRKDIRGAYTYHKASLDIFNRLQQERSDKADPQRIKESVGALMDITEVANHIPEALEWVERYNEFVPEDSPEYPGLRFREARLHRKLGDNAKAKTLLELIVGRYKESPFAQAAETELRTFAVSRDLRNFLPGGQGGGQSSEGAPGAQ